MLTTQNRSRSKPARALLCGLLLLLAAGCAPDGARALLKGDKLLRAGEYTEAVSRLEVATRLLPTNAVAWNQLAVAFHGAGRTEEAARAYHRALELDRNLSIARYNIGCLYLEQDRPADAVREFLTFTGMQVNSDAGWFKLAQAQLRARQLEAAERSFAQALQLNPRSAATLNGLGVLQVMRGRTQAGLEQFESALALQPGYAPAILNQAITYHVHLKNKPLALRKYQEYLGLDLLLQNRPALDDLTRQLMAELQPAPSARATTAATSPLRTSEVARASHARPESRPPSARPSSPSPETPPARRETTAPRETVAPRPDQGQAAPSVTTTPRQSPAAAEPRAEPRPSPPPESTNSPAARVRAPAPPRERIIPPPARSSERRYVYRLTAPPQAGDRSEADRLVTLGRKAQDESKPVEALAAYRQAVQADPASYEAQYRLGYVAQEQGKTDDALAAYEAALQIKPGDTRARYNFAAALQSAGYYRDAAVEFTKVVTERPKDAELHFLLGHLYAERLQDPRRAREHYLRLLELDPRHAQAPAIRYWLEANP